MDTSDLHPRAGGDRRRAAVGVVVLLAAALGLVQAQRVAVQHARTEAAAQQAEVDFAQDVVAATAELRRAAGALREAAADVDSTLEEHLLAPGRPRAVLADDLADGTRRLRTLAATLRTEAAAPAPRHGPLVDGEVAATAMQPLATARTAARRVADDAAATADDAVAWGRAVRRVTAAARRHAAAASTAAPADDTAALAAAWEAERAPLEALSSAAADADDVPGLDAWADAHHRYARRTLRLVDAAVDDLGAGRLAAYNERLAATLDVEDPFGFRAEVEEATRSALRAPVLRRLDGTQGRAGQVLAHAERTDDAALRLADAAQPADAGA